jgi:hypothetical protein
VRGEERYEQPEIQRKKPGHKKERPVKMPESLKAKSLQSFGFS